MNPHVLVTSSWLVLFNLCPTPTFSLTPSYYEADPSRHKFNA